MRFGRSAVAGDDGSVVFYSCELGMFYCACLGEERGGGGALVRFVLKRD